MSAQIFNTQLVPHNAKWTFTTRRVNKSDIVGTTTAFGNAVSGDLIMAEVVRISSHTKAQLASGRPSVMSVGDIIIACVGDRYAPDQFEGIGDVSSKICDLLAGGGVIGKANLAHAKMSAPTQVRPLGLLTDAGGEVINIASYSIPHQKAPTDMPVIAVVGASMNAGKTTATAALAHGLTKAGLKVAGIKATGTGAFGDYNAMLDAGLNSVADFTDAGMATTYRQPIERIEQGLKSLLASAKAQGAEIAVVELADGIYQQETAELLEHSAVFRSLVNGVMFACGDAVATVGGVRHLRALGLDPIAVSGMVSLSPLAMREAESLTGINIFSRNQLKTPEFAKGIVSRAVRNLSPCVSAAA